MTIASARSHFYATLPNVSPVPTFPFLLFYAFFFLLFPPSPLSRQFIFATARSSLIGLRFLVHNFRVTSVVDNDGRCGLISGDRWKCTRVNDRSNIIDRHFSFFPLPLVSHRPRIADEAASWDQPKGRPHVNKLHQANR